MSGEPTFTFPPPIIEALADALWEMKDAPPHCVSRVNWRVMRINLKTDSGWITILRGQDMERT